MIERRTNKTPFVAVASSVIRSGGLTPEELGLYACMAAKPDNWEFVDFVLARECGTTPQEIRRILNGLERKGYVRERSGRHGAVWDFFETAKLPERTPELKAEGERTLSNTEMAQRFFDQAKKLAAIRDLNRAIRH